MFGFICIQTKWKKRLFSAGNNSMLNLRSCLKLKDWQQWILWKISHKRIRQQYSIKIELFPVSILESLTGLSNIERPWTGDSVPIHRFISICIGVSSIVKDLKVDFLEITFGKLFVTALKLLWEEDKILIVFLVTKMTKSDDTFE